MLLYFLKNFRWLTPSYYFPSHSQLNLARLRRNSNILLTKKATSPLQTRTLIQLQRENCFKLYYIPNSHMQPTQQLWFKKLQVNNLFKTPTLPSQSSRAMFKQIAEVSHKLKIQMNNLDLTTSRAGLTLSNQWFLRLKNFWKVATWIYVKLQLLVILRKKFSENSQLGRLMKNFNY